MRLTGLLGAEFAERHQQRTRVLEGQPDLPLRELHHERILLRGLSGFGHCPGMIAGHLGRHLRDDFTVEEKLDEWLAFWIDARLMPERSFFRGLLIAHSLARRVRHRGEV